MQRLALPLALASLAVACGRSGTSPPPPATETPMAQPAAASTTSPPPVPLATTTPAPAAPRAPATEILRSAVAVEPAARTPLTSGAEAVVHPSATFEVELSARSADARLVLVDARDDLVPATGVRELSAGTRLTLAPATPLVPGSRYALRLDGATERDLHDDTGRAYEPVSFRVLTAGTPPPPEPKRPERKRRKR